MLFDVRPSRKRRQVRRQQWRRREVRYFPALRLLAANLRLVAEQLPAFRAGEVHLVAGLEIRLVKAGEDAAGIGWLEVRVKVRSVIGLVVHAVQALAGAGVIGGAGDLHGEFLPHWKIIQVDPSTVEGVLHLLTVDAHCVHGLAQVIHEGLGLSGGEANARGDLVRVGVGWRARDVEVQLVGAQAQRGAAGGSFCMGEVCGSHVLHLKRHCGAYHRAVKIEPTACWARAVGHQDRCALGL